MVFQKLLKALYVVGHACPSSKKKPETHLPTRPYSQRTDTWHGCHRSDEDKEDSRQKRETGEAACLRVHYEQGTAEPWGFQKLLGSQRALVSVLGVSSGSAGSVPSNCDEPALSLVIISNLILLPGSSGSY